MVNDVANNKRWTTVQSSPKRFVKHAHISWVATKRLRLRVSSRLCLRLSYLQTGFDLVVSNAFVLF